jgi:hypothetical protein
MIEIQKIVNYLSHSSLEDAKLKRKSKIQMREDIKRPENWNWMHKHRSMHTDDDGEGVYTLKNE